MDGLAAAAAAAASIARACCTLNVFMRSCSRLTSSFRRIFFFCYRRLGTYCLVYSNRLSSKTVSFLSFRIDRKTLLRFDNTIQLVETNANDAVDGQTDVD